jgi:hypothetical protein
MMKVVTLMGMVVAAVVVAAAAFVIAYLLYNIKLPVTAPAHLEHRAAISPA